MLLFSRIRFVFRELKPGLHVRRKHKHKQKHKKPTCKPVRRKHLRLVLALVLYACVVQVYTYDAKTQA